MQARATKTLALGMLAGCGLTLALGAGLQPARNGAGPLTASRAAEEPPRWTMDTAAVRERFVDLRERTDKAIAALDGGAEPPEVLRTFVDDSPLLQFLMRGPRGPRPELGGPPPEAVRRHIAERSPELDERLRSLEETHPDLAQRFLERVGERMGDAIGEDTDDPELAGLKAAEFEASLRVFDTARRLRAPLAEGTVSEADARAQLAEALGAHLDARQEVAKHEIGRLREHLARTERDVNAFDERRADEIERMTDKIMHRLRADRGDRGAEHDRPRGRRRNAGG